MTNYNHIFEAFKDTKRTKENLPQLFRDIAKYFLKEGYFLVNGTKRVYICDVEFYYHEEEGDIKDWIMYHRNNHPNNKIKKPEYFDLGQFNTHTSGIDITFENEQQQYRAGMLIRGFKVVEEPPLKENDSIFDYDKRSTYFYEALLNCPMTTSGLTVQWIEEKNEFKLEDKNIVDTYRQNVPHYKAENVKYEWESEEDGKYFTSGKYKFKQCMSKWRFHLTKNTTYFSK